MPFQVSRDDPARPQPVLQIVGTTTFRLQTGFVFRHGTTYIDVPADGPGEVTDLATVPPWLWGLLASYGRQTLPALMHDRLCDAAEQAAPAKRYALRRQADSLFRLALLDEGVSSFRAATFWAGVVLGRLFLYRRVQSIFLIASVLLSTVAFYLGTVLAIASSGATRWTGLALVVAAVLLAVPWLADRVYAAFLVGTYVGLPVLVLLAVDLLVQVWISVVPWGVQWVLSLLPGIDRPRGTPTIRPTRVRPVL